MGFSSPPPVEQDPITPFELSRETDNEFRDQQMTLSELSQFAELMIIDDLDSDTAKRILEPFWGFMDKENVIANIKRDEIPRIMNRLAITEMTQIMSQPFKWFSWQEQLLHDNIEQKVWLKSTRSSDGFERRELGTQHKIIETNQVNKQQKMGLLQRIFSFGRPKQ